MDVVYEAVSPVANSLEVQECKLQWLAKPDAKSK